MDRFEKLAQLYTNMIDAAPENPENPCILVGYAGSPAHNNFLSVANKMIDFIVSDFERWAEISFYAAPTCGRLPAALQRFCLSSNVS